jgi:imidazolonepropionase-like amidohydrolase
MSKTTIFAEVLYDGRKKLTNQIISMEGDEIIDVSPGKPEDADLSGFVTPAFIDAHSHIAMIRQGEPSGEADINDTIGQITPLQDPLNSVYFDDRGLEEAVDFGVLYSCIVPGSGNLLGGKAIIIRNYAKNRSTGLYKDYGYKMALGYNPKSTKDWKGTRPSTRMGVYALLEETFDKLILKEKKLLHEKKVKISELEKKLSKKEISRKELDQEISILDEGMQLEFSPEEQALLEILHGEKTVKVHVHKEDDALYMVYLNEKYDIRFTAEHTCDVHNKEIYDTLAKHEIPVLYGPVGSLDYKVELKHASYKHVKVLMQSKVNYGLITDHPVILATNLRDSLKYFLIQGMSSEEAISIITYKNASILGIDDKLGTVEPGKTASILVWDKDPLHMGAFPRAVFAEGKRIR